ncbi:MAG: FKBP-type peptidyl-prolyl cis-trans isomerase [bacterium]
MAKPKNGNVVRVHYTGTLDDGKQFDSSIGREPLEFTIGGGEVLEQFDTTAASLEPGETTKIHIKAEDGYGDYDPEFILVLDKSQFPKGLEPKIGMKMQVPFPNDGPVVATITKVENGKITFDGNHDLAGKDLNFEIKLVEIVK